MYWSDLESTVSVEPEDQLTAEAPVALAILQATVRGDRSAALAMLQALPEQFGPGGIVKVMFVWIECLMSMHATPSAGQVAITAVHEGRVLDAQQVPPPERFAMQLIGCRLAQDHDTWHALILALRDTGRRDVDEASDWILAVLSMCASGILTKMHEPLRPWWRKFLPRRRHRIIGLAVEVQGGLPRAT